VNNVEFTGERVVPGGTTPANIFNEHEHRYNFAAQFVPGQVVLDIACGSGMGSQFLLEAGAKKVLGVDIDRQSLSVASNKYPKIEFTWGDASRHIPFSDASVDVVVSFETIEHLQDQERFLNECRRVLKGGGRFICSSPNRDVTEWLPPSRFHVKELGAMEFIALMHKHFPRAATRPHGGVTFAQRDLQYPKLVARALARTATEAMGIKTILQRLLKIRPEPRAQRDHFVVCPHGIRPYRRRQLHKPMFLIYVGDKT